MTPHLVRNLRIVEVWIDGRMVGTIYPTESGIKVISKYAGTVKTEEADCVTEVSIELMP